MEKILLIGTNDILIYNLHNYLVEKYKKENIYLILIDKIGYYKVNYENKIIINKCNEIENIIKLINPIKIIFSIPNYVKLYTNKFIMYILQLSIIINEYNCKIIIINYINKILKKGLELFNIKYTLIKNCYSEYDYYTKMNHNKIIKNKKNYKHICNFFYIFLIELNKNEEDYFKDYLDWYNKTDQNLLYEL